ncbi:MAG: peptidoglycan-binding domain-containing protein [Acidimicrobiia bacterium]
MAYLQRLLSHLGQPARPDGILGSTARAALSAVQLSLGFPGTGRLDDPAIAALLKPLR